VTTPELLGPVASDRDAELARVAQRCMMAALDHAGVPRIALVDQDGDMTEAPILELPPMPSALVCRHVRHDGPTPPFDAGTAELSTDDSRVSSVF
jgi:hypothetical protein